jgi:polyisoprenoid-binding protein YceI
MSLPIAPGNYAIDPLHTQIGFSITHLGITPVRGIFTGYSGTLEVGDSAASSSLAVAIDLSTVASGHPMRDEHLQGPDYFDTAGDGTMTFRSTAISGSGDDWTIDGNLSLKGETHPIRLTAKLSGKAVFPMDQKERIGFVASGTLDRKKYNVGGGIPGFVISDDVEVNLAVQLVASD